jgi:hypothetical protein
MLRVAWESEAPARLQEFRQILAEARNYYVTRPDSEAETRLWIRSDGRVGGRRMLRPFETPPGFTWPIVDLDRRNPNGRGWMRFEVDRAFWNACRMRADYWNMRAQKYLEVAV